MPEFDEKFVEAVAKILRLTQENIIKWRSAKTPSNLRNDDESRVNSIFLAEHNQRCLRLYEHHYFINTSSFLPNLLSRWDSRVVLEIVDSDGNHIWTFPQVSPLKDLLETVRYQVADVSDFIDSLLDERVQPPLLIE